MEGKKLVKKSGLYFIGSLSAKIMPILLLPVHAATIGKADFGDFDFAQTVMNLAAPVFFVAIWEAILKFIMGGSDKKERVVAVSCIFTLAVGAGIMFLAFIAQMFFGGFIKNLYYTAIITISYGFMFIWQYFARSLGKNVEYVVAGIIGAVVNFTANIVLIFVCGLKLDALFLAYIAGNVSVFLFLEMKVRVFSRDIFGNADRELLGRMLKFSAPLVLNQISTWLITYFGRIVIINYLGSDYNGLYAYANKFAIIITMLGSVINMAIIEEALVSAREKGIDKSFAETFQKLFKIFQSVLIPAAPAIAVYYFFIRSTDYYASMEYFPMLLLYSLVMIMTASIGTVFQVIDKTKYQFITTALGSLVTVAISLFFINAWGLYAVIAGQLAGSAVMFVSRYVFINMHVEFKLKWLPMIVYCIMYLAAAYICIYGGIFASAALLPVTVIGMAFANKDFIKKALDMLKGKK